MTASRRRRPIASITIFESFKLDTISLSIDQASLPARCAAGRDRRHRCVPARTDRYPKRIAQLVFRYGKTFGFVHGAPIARSGLVWPLLCRTAGTSAFHPPFQLVLLVRAEPDDAFVQLRWRGLGLDVRVEAVFVFTLDKACDRVC